MKFQELAKKGPPNENSLDSKTARRSDYSGPTGHFAQNYSHEARDHRFNSGSSVLFGPKATGNDDGNVTVSAHAQASEVPVIGRRRRPGLGANPDLGATM